MPKPPFIHRLAFLFLALTLSASRPVLAANDWQTLENCKLLHNASNDGDSFHVQHAGKEYIFRLYYVDCCETEDEFPERVAEQAAYFHITHKHALEMGKAAARFTHDQLATNRFTVITRMQDARGQSKLPREYAFIHVGGSDLGELLVEGGLARVYGMKAVLPNGTSTKTEEDKLLHLEHEAKAQHRGAWGVAAKTSSADLNLSKRLFIPTNERHNRNCPFYNAPNTRPCAPDEGKACHICGG